MFKSDQAVPELKKHLSAKPTHVFFALGAIDAADTPPRPIKDNLANGIREAKKHGILPLLAGIKPTDDIRENIDFITADNNLPKNYILDFGTLYPQLAEEHKIPLWAHILKGMDKIDMQDPEEIQDFFDAMGTRFAQFLEDHIIFPSN